MLLLLPWHLNCVCGEAANAKAHLWRLVDSIRHLVSPACFLRRKDSGGSSSLSNSTETAILTLAWQALYPRSHLSSTSLSLQGKQVWCFLLLSRGISDLTESYLRLIPRDSGISEHEKKTYWVETLTALSSLGFMYAQNVLDVPTNRGATALWYAVSPWPCALWAYPSSQLSILISRALFYNKISIFLFLIMSPWQSSIVVGHNYLDIWKVSLGMVCHCSYTQVFNYNIW